MLGGYMGYLLHVDLTCGLVETRNTDENTCNQLIGGYGYGARVLLKDMPPETDPLGPKNILGFITGPLTGTPAITGSRFTVVGKSPLTQTWGDANCGGFFGPYLKFAGYDGIFLVGISPHPIYLMIQDRQARLQDAGDLWGKDCYDTEEILKKRHGEDSEVVCIGPAGERQVFISSIMTHFGRAAARSGLGAVMGAKRLKAIVVKGSCKVPVSNPEQVKRLYRKYLHEIRTGVGFSEQYTTVGTLAYVETGILIGDSPTKNYGGIGPNDINNPENLSYEKIIDHRVERKACWHCPIACWGTIAIHENGYNVNEAHQPEYETWSAFGSNCGNTNLASIVKANDLCNRLGLDTISTGSVIAFAMECYENGLLKKSDTNGLDLTWGNHRVMVSLIEKIGYRDGIGKLLADGVMRAADQIGGSAEAFAMHVGGQELPMHDSRYEPSLACIYRIDATPGRHTQAAEYWAPDGLPQKVPQWGAEPDRFTGRARAQKVLSCMCHCLNASGICMFGYYSTSYTMVSDFLEAVTGDNWTYDRILETGERIAVVRHAFNLREGLNPLRFFQAPRSLGIPPPSQGPRKGITVDIGLMLREYLDEMNWNKETSFPSKECLKRLCLDDLIGILYK
jgi:aldehyde:ferredoxin oxidoreductase